VGTPDGKTSCLNVRRPGRTLKNPEYPRGSPYAINETIIQARSGKRGQRVMPQLRQQVRASETRSPASGHERAEDRTARIT